MRPRTLTSDLSYREKKKSGTYLIVRLHGAENKFSIYRVAEAVSYGDWAQIPSDVVWSEITKVTSIGNCRCSVKMKMKREYISQIHLDEFHELLECVNKSGKFCYVDPDFADHEFRAFSSWRNANFFEGKVYIFTVEKFDENTQLSLLCTWRSDHGDEDGFGVEPDCGQVLYST